MSITWTHVPVIVDQDRRANGSGEIAVEAVDRLVARVLCRAHRAAEAVDAPDEARVILHLAQCFADELAAASPRFDRLRFIEAATTASP
jgi:hypothetical protein